MMAEKNYENKIWIINWSDYHQEFRVQRFSNPKDAVAWMPDGFNALSFIQNTYPEYEIILIRWPKGSISAILNGEIWKRVK